ncbi:MAG TPA: M48 family metallopeptidase [Candidatus Nanopelagicaceae bacterium]|nr:M48 family metallopeptidase [Candidatus Nanopelagicaceae bacterium]
MKKIARFGLFIFFLLITISFSLVSISLLDDWIMLLGDWIFYALFIFYLLSIEELYRWAKFGKRSEMSDFVALLFFFFLILFISKDVFTSIMGAFSIYLWFGIAELKDYPVLNKILIISLVTYNVIFVSGIISNIIGNPIVINTAFSFSFWIILGLGFILFGRKYIVIWRFMSPEYLTLFLYIIAWLAIVFINQYTPLNFISQKALLFNTFSVWELFMNVYTILMAINWIIYFISGPILDFMLGIKPLKDKRLLDLIEGVKSDLGIKGKVKVGIGNYPIINAMAYGSFFDKRIALIAENYKLVPEDEIKGITAHELAHTKGKHTLILTLLTTGDLIFRMLFGIPATYYDYTFGNPQLPFIFFILLNLLIYIILFMFVRILEGKADQKTKKIGYAKELVKALYNLESFYATGREFGLNTMLLSEEKITQNNEILNYLDTADYINKSIIKPKRSSLISNIINSHPLTYHRIAAILDDTLKPTKEMFLPFLCLKKSNQKHYAKLFEKARVKFKVIASEKFKEYFNISDISAYMQNLNRIELYKLELEKDFIFKHKITDEIIVGKLESVRFNDDICEIDEYIVKEFKNNNKIHLNSSEYTKSQISLRDDYFLEKEGILNLIDIDISSDQTKAEYVFLDKDGHKIFKRLKKTKLPNSISTIKMFTDKDIFFNTKGETIILRCLKVEISQNFKNSELYFEMLPQNDGDKTFHYKLKDLIIKPKNTYITINRNKTVRKSELKIFDWLIEKQLRTYIYLKKPVNNLEIGYIQDIKLDIEHFKKKPDQGKSEVSNYITIKNIFGKDIKIPYKSLEALSFEHITGNVQKKSETSIFSKLGYIILKKVKPEKIFYLNKV